MKIEEMEKIEKFYTEIYNEDNRLRDSTDRRHQAEVITKNCLLNGVIASGDCVAEIGAGKGFWVGKLLDMGCSVKAFDLVEEHVSILNERFRGHPRFLGAEVLNIAERPSCDGKKYDAVLLSGPLYHLKGDTDRINAIKNASRMVLSMGWLLIDYLSPANAALEYILSDEKSPNTFCLDKPKEENLFSYCEPEEMDWLLDKSVKNKMFVSHHPLDGMSRLFSERLERLSESSWEDYLALLWEKASHPVTGKELCHWSEHNLVKMQIL